MFSSCIVGFPGGSVVKNLPINAGALGSIPGSRKSPGEGNGNQLQCSCLRNPVNMGACKSMGSQRVQQDLATKPQQRL